MQPNTQSRVPAFLVPYLKLPQSIHILFIAQIINSAGSFIAPFLTLLLSNKLGMKTEQVGFFVMLSLLAQMPGMVIGGKLADHFNRKAILVGAQALAAIFLLGCALIPDPHFIPWLLIISNLFGGAVRPVNNALVADLTDVSNRQTAFSLTYLGINVGCALGPMVAGFLFQKHTAWLFIGDALTTLIAVLLVAFLVKERDRESPAGHPNNPELIHPDEQAETGSFWQVMGKRPYLTAMILLLSVFSFVYSQHSFALPLDLTEKFGHASPEIFGMLCMVNALVVVFCTTIIIWLTRRMQPLQCISLAGLFYAGGFGMYLFTKSLPGFIVATVIWTIGEVLSVTHNGVYIACHAPVSHRARFNALQTFSFGVGNCLGPVLMGKYITHHGISAVWTLSFFLACAAALMMYGIGFWENKNCVESELN